MTTTSGQPQTPLMRVSHSQMESRVSRLELFFDLVFVFAITQLSHNLLSHFTPLSGLHTLLLLMAVWWVWMSTTWVTNWLNPETGPVRIMLMVLMLVGLVLASAIPEAFAEKGLLFAGSYALMQVGRTIFALWAMWRSDQRANFMRILSWASVSAVLWVAGGVAADGWRLGLWLTALALDYIGPLTGFVTPGWARVPPTTGRSAANTWPNGLGCLSSSRSARASWSWARPSPSCRWWPRR